MNSLKNYFSPTKMNEPAVPQTPELAASVGPDDTTLQDSPAVSNSRQIISNMESVMNSVKKKHRHRKKKDLNKSEPEITDISNILSNSLSFVSPDISLDSKVPDIKSPLKENRVETVTKHRRVVKRSRKNGQPSADSTPSSSQASASTTDSGIILSPSKNGSIRNHFSPKNTATANEQSANKQSANEQSANEQSVNDQSTNEKTNAKPNAFALMMSARNRSIGSNTPGKLSPKVEIAATLDPEKVKRKLMLEEWAYRKGGRKRKIEELQREEFIDNVLEKRAKRFKKMLVGGKNTEKPAKKVGRPKKIRPADLSLNGTKDQIELGPSSQGDEKKSPVPPKKKLGRPKKIKKPEEVATPTVVVNTDPKPKLKVRLSQATKRVRRISSDEISPIVPNSQDSDFVQKLSSPIKKRDSLLGYFQKVLSPNESVTDVNNPEIGTTPTSRPRRTCAGKARYDYDLEMSPTKNRIESKVNKRQKPATVIDDDLSSLDETVEVICLDVSSDNVMKKTSKKLAPLFVKSVPKPAVDPEILKAKQNFLMSGVPEKLKMEIAKQKKFDDTYEISLETMFPRISHVGRDLAVSGEETDVDWEKCGVIFRNVKASPDRKMNSRKTVAAMKPFTPEKKPLPALEKLIDLDDKVEFVKNLKSTYDKFPTYRCYKQLRDKYRLRKAIGIEQVSESFMIMNTGQNGNSKCIEDDTGGGNGDLLFTEKYKPMNSEQVLVNFHPVNELKNFLSGWQNERGSKLNDSMSDFDMSNDSMSLGNCNSVVLHGPSSSGKTNAVFALANEMNFNVLEINAGMKRTGKKILQELQEATQSHQVSKDKSNLLKKSFGGVKRKLTDLNDSSSSTDLINGSAKLSLILIEDADIAFEQDGGFVEAIHQLVSSSKRPVIIISNNSECQHLLRLQKQSAIEFAMPNVLNISKFLSIMSLVENCPIELDDIISLYLYNRRNLRKTLLELQFFILSGGDRIRGNGRKLLQTRKYSVEESDSSAKEDTTVTIESKTKATKQYIHQTLFEFYTIDQNSSFLLQFPVDFDCLHYNLKEIFAQSKNIVEQSTKKGRKAKSPRRTKSDSNDESFGNLVKFYDNISIASYLTANEVEDRLCENLQETIAHTLCEQAIRVNMKTNARINNAPRTIPDRQQLAPYLPSSCVRTNRSIDLDYEPMLRTICRSEKSRSSIERRGSRFYHYLRNICTSTSSFSTLEFDKTCSVFAATETDSGNDVGQ